jgi:hypothetical protein
MPSGYHQIWAVGGKHQHRLSGTFQNNADAKGEPDIIKFKAVGEKHQHRHSGTFQNNADAKKRVGNPLILLDFNR